MWSAVGLTPLWLSSLNYLGLSECLAQRTESGGKPTALHIRN